MKFFKLCSCEYTKIIKKKSTKIMILLLICTIFLAAGITQLEKVMEQSIYNSADFDSQNQLDSEIEHTKMSLKETSLDTTTRNKLQAELEAYELAKQYNVNMFDYKQNHYWRSNIISDIIEAKINEYNHKSAGQEKEANEARDIANKRIEILKNDDFNSYIEFKKEDLKRELTNKNISNDEYDIKLKSIELQEKYQVGKTISEEDNWKYEIITDIETLSRNINTGINQVTGKALNETDLNKAKELILIDNYKLAHNIKPSLSEYEQNYTSKRKMYDYFVSSFTISVLTILTIIVAGSSISSEISKGTIKFWAFTPNKRWKILLSKLCVITFMLFFTTILVTLLGDLVGNLLFGVTNTDPYLYVQNNTVHEINYILYTLLLNLVKSLEIFVYLLFALMLSVITRNTAVAVGISIATDLGSSMFMPILNSLIKSDWIKFLPFNNFNLAQRIFPNDLPYFVLNMQSELLNNVSVKFSLIVLAVCSILMIITMFDSFRKRDII